MSGELSAEVIAKALSAHKLTTGMQVASGETCQCGYWNREERPGVDRPPGVVGLNWHRAQVVAELVEAYGAERERAALLEAADAVFKDGTIPGLLRVLIGNWIRTRAGKRP
ncbi:hypothetical protein [Arthrobacter roseus]|uniref:hypothetical protein n=1 Tax=Arthrobacter roseus TaxID=136274 RepID=UPI0019659AA0|nr:hypothetical protein [Arthrobacter roseus]MBM7847497.1 hypothetical protein [Arthrobacter roseus]